MRGLIVVSEASAPKFYSHWIDASELSSLEAEIAVTHVPSSFRGASAEMRLFLTIPGDRESDKMILIIIVCHRKVLKRLDWRMRRLSGVTERTLGKLVSVADLL